MIKSVLLFLSTFLLTFAVPPNTWAEDFTLTIGSQSVDLTEGTPITTKILGQETTLLLKQREFSQYEDDWVSFTYPSRYGLTKSDLSDSIKQLTLVSGSGSLLLIQEYTKIAPSVFAEVVLKEMVKQELAYGYSMTKEAYSEIVADGIELTGLRATTKLDSKEIHYIILGYDGKDKGLLFVLRTDNQGKEATATIKGTVWKSLRIKSR